MITGGQSIVSAPPAFSSDGRLFLVCSGRTVSVFSTATAMLVSELEGHEGDVTAVVVMPPPAGATATPAAKLASNCWTAGLDGVLIYWDFVAAEAVRKVQVGLPVHSMVIPNICRTSKGAEVSTPFAFISVEDTSKPVNEAKALRGQLRIYDLTKGRKVGYLLAETSKPEKIVASSSGEFLGITNKRKLHIWRIPTKDFKHDKIRKIKLRHTKNLTTLAFHPSEGIVAAGDVTGRILIWRGFGNAKFSESSAKSKVDERRDGVRGNDDADTCTTWHWHSSRVRFLKFSSDGAYLFSGGLEGVIVVWQLDTGKRRYKPRLGSPLLFFVDSPDSSISCVSCTNNQVYLLKMPNMEVMRSIAGIKLPTASPTLGGSDRVVYGFDYTNNLVAIPTADYCIQFYNLFENTEVSELQVCERNFQPVDDITMYISVVSLSIDGSLMCTVDVKLPEEELGGLVTLKFWNGSSAGNYFLSTVIYEPHSDAGVSAVVFRPGRNMAVSSSFGGNFKVWVQSFSSQSSNERNYAGWRCQSVGSYKKKPMTAAAFSADGSVLAVAAESVITLWDPDNNALVGVIAETLSPITNLSFVGTSVYLMSLCQSSKPEVTVWNVSNLSMQWAYSIYAEAACCSPDGNEFAVLTLLSCPDGGTSTEQNGAILLFNAESPNTVASWSVKKARGGNISFVKGDVSSKDKETMVLVYVNGSHEYVIFDPLKREGLVISRNIDKKIQAEELAPIGYASIYGELPKLESKKEVSDVPFIPSDRPWETIFSGSSHVLPPLTKLCSAFLSSVLEKRPVANE
ncbi:WD repeat-containing protein 75 [Panicum miliaceum]|uniref:WD repeat-containing protein 75 n=1 Tax=Panicum miliaceum TaxID=4540 RepID=A0A3L6REH8_PANMI|nr:WD repeat-containing protein 75 [Panicum miliaceum]